MAQGQCAQPEAPHVGGFPKGLHVTSGTTSGSKELAGSQLAWLRARQVGAFLEVKALLLGPVQAAERITKPVPVAQAYRLSFCRQAVSQRMWGESGTLAAAECLNGPRPVLPVLAC